MFKKKHSEIKIQLQNTAYSPFRKNSNCSPFSRTPDRSNLSPMKVHHKNKGYSAKSPRKQLIPEPFSANKLPSTREANFQTQLQFLGNTILSEYESAQKHNQGKFCSRTPFGYDGSAFQNISNYQASDRHMKDSKKIFANVLSKMNSDKKKAEATSNQCSVFEESKQYTTQNNYALPTELPIASFKALKQIKMIESVHPLPPPPLLEKSSSKKSNNYEPVMSKQPSRQSNRKANVEYEFNEPINEFKVQSKREKIVQLINQSFSISAPAMEKVFDQVEIKNDELLLGREANILESMYVDESYDFRQLNTLLSKLDEKSETSNQTGQVELQSVKVSMESAKFSLTMDPFL